MNNKNSVLLGCGILQREIRFLIEKNDWLVDTDFLDSSLHVNFERLEYALQRGFERNKGRDIAVFYGCCHPRMENLLEAAHAFRTEGQNCVEMLLGRAMFMDELSKGAFFLMEDWALRWDEVIGETFGGKPDVVREIFQISSKYLLCLRTPCSGDFTTQAQEIGGKLGMPVHWADVGLDNLEAVLHRAVNRVESNAPNTAGQ
ncbi:DUF1638 domain-containing protein [Candidatus Methylospira mobilis]|uniref:DUF1638 domain-containing protein n=1 Tax=Candidatus Methylospira mobilis TaxID=1808979 RepID=A0A5Q0BFN7_9GAMM|nr:DUF1638 domain-containing protein [Candidatus Methylospira mobilis]QFY42349.1 DUF1638 domain-containing protein [Candidatus Methylospira mobilis]WNV04559.1 DUF1638 domain-containing protein [Candidatus Methylospira mobilis]